MASAKRRTAEKAKPTKRLTAQGRVSAADSTRTEQQEQALQMLADGAMPIEVSAALGVHRTTLFKWRQRPDFAARLAELRAPIIETAKRDLMSATTRAVELLGALLADELAPHAVRLRAAELVLERSGLDSQAVLTPTDPRALAKFIVAFHRDLLEEALDEEQLPEPKADHDPGDLQ